MSFLNSLNIDLVFNIVCVIFISTLCWKVRKLHNTVKEIDRIKEDLNLVIRNPQAAKRKLKRM